MKQLFIALLISGLGFLVLLCILYGIFLFGGETELTGPQPAKITIAVLGALFWCICQVIAIFHGTNTAKLKWL